MEHLQLIQEGRHYDPYGFLGLHGTTLRVWLPDAAQVQAIFPSGVRFDLALQDGFGLFSGTVQPEAGKYQLHITFKDGNTLTTYDPYSFLPTLSDFDLELLAKGDHHMLYRKLGANVLEHEGVQGVGFAVWAPNAERVSVIGNFNGWNGLRHPMRSLGGSGIWEIFIPELKAGEYYKFEVRSKSGNVMLKTDPVGKYGQLRPETASVVWDLSYTWSDQTWMHSRKPDTRKDPISIYEVHLPSWAKGEGNSYLNYRELAHRIADYVSTLGYTHIEILPVTEYPFDGSWGYQVTGYFAPTSRLGTPQDLMYFVDYLHQRGLGVIMDWVPGHFPKDSHGLAYFDGTALYEYADPRKGQHLDWGTHIFDYGRSEVANFLIASALFWLDVYHIDGLRVDAVASILYLDFSRPANQWVPNIYGGNENLEAIAFLKRFNELTHQYFPGTLMMAEESSSFPGVTKPVYLGGLGFDYKWGMGWMNDSLKYIEQDSVYRKYDHHKITFFMVYNYSENYVLPISHDEVVHGKHSLLSKMPGDDWQKFANVRAFLGYMWTMPGKKLLFQGQDFGQWQEWNEAYSIDWHLAQYAPHQGIQNLVSDLNRLYRTQKALHSGDHLQGGFEWIHAGDSENSIYSFMRKDVDGADFVVVVLNFTPVERQHYRVGVPVSGLYQEVLNSDSQRYGGSNRGNLGSIHSDAVPSGHFAHSLKMLIPALSIVVLKLYA